MCDGFREPLYPLWDGSGLKLHWSPDFHMTLTGGPQWCFGSPGISASSEPMSSNNKTVWLFSFPHCPVTPVKGLKSLWGRLGERLTMYIFGTIVGSFRKGAPFPPLSRDSESVTWFKFGNCLKGCESQFLWFKLDSCSVFLCLLFPSYLTWHYFLFPQLFSKLLMTSVRFNFSHLTWSLNSILHSGPHFAS